MKKQVTLGLAVAGLFIITGAILLQQRTSGTRGSTVAPPPVRTGSSEPSVAGATTAGPGASASSNPAGSASPSAGLDSSAAVDPAQRAAVATALAALNTLYGDAGSLNWNDTKALVAKRRKAAEELVETLAKLGPGGARAIADGYTETQDTRAKLLLVAALARVDDPQATAALDELLHRDDSFSLRKEIVVAMGKRPEANSGVVLAGLLLNEPDARLRSTAVEALSGRAEALSALSERIRTDPSPDVRLESVHVVGSIGNQAAQDLLATVATGSMEMPVRQKAILELARSSGERALGVFDGLLNDPNETIRQTAVKAIARLHGERALALLQQTAVSGASAATREMARLALPGQTAAE